MKKFLSTLALLFTVVTFGQTLPAPSDGHWVIVDTSYTVGTTTTGTTEADLYYTNQNGENITGLQFRVWYDNVAFNGAAPTVALRYGATDQYMQYVVDQTNGNITVTLVYTGTNTNFSYADGAAIGITFTHAIPATWNTLDSVKTLKISGTQTFSNLASTNLGNDTTLTLYSYGGSFIQRAFTFSGKFKTPAGDPAKNLWLALEKKPKTGSTWSTVETVKTNTAGRFSFTQTLDTTYWHARIKVQGDTMSIGNVISTADAQKINQTVLGQYTPTGFDFYTMDVNGSNSVTITDAYAVFGKLAGNFATWPNSAPNILFFTETQYASINGSATSQASTIPGVTNFEYLLNGKDSVTYYVAVKGDANSTGFKMARLVPVTIVNPNNAPNYIIDQTVQYDNVIDEIEVRFPDLTVNEGNLVNVPVTVITGQDNLSALQLNVKYDQDLLEFKSLLNSEKAMKWMSYFNPTNGAVEWGGADFSNVNNLVDGDLAFTLQFTALKPKLNWTISPLYVAEKYVGDAVATDMNIRPTNGRIEIRKRDLSSDILEGFDIMTYPNPTTGFTSIQFNVLQDSKTEVAIFDITGRKLIQVVNEYVPAGQYVYEVDLSVLANGVYYTSILTDEQVATSRTIIFK
jgi:hypothetical protein